MYRLTLSYTSKTRPRYSHNPVPGFLPPVETRCESRLGRWGFASTLQLHRLDKPRQSFSISFRFIVNFLFNPFSNGDFHLWFLWTRFLRISYYKQTAHLALCLQPLAKTLGCHFCMLERGWKSWWCRQRAELIANVLLLWHHKGLNWGTVCFRTDFFISG